MHLLFETISMQDNVIIVLVRPQYLGNLGSVARVMKNFGFGRLRLVNPPRNYMDSEARRMSVNAFDVLKNAEVFESLPDALKDISLALGTSSGQQRDFKPVAIKDAVPNVRECIQTSKCAIVFGDEVNGLSRDDLLRCHHIVTIPTNPDFAALNMAQAVGIAVYELSSLQMPETTAPTEFSSGAQDDEIFELLGKVLHNADFSRSFNQNKVITEFRSFYQRAHPTKREAELLRGALLRIGQKIESKV
jgi:TrmH family RNA methyltransferase